LGVLLLLMLLLVLLVLSVAAAPVVPPPLLVLVLLVLRLPCRLLLVRSESKRIRAGSTTAGTVGSAVLDVKVAAAAASGVAGRVAVLLGRGLQHLQE
jgi:uncharacterized membrane protein